MNRRLLSTLFAAGAASLAFTAAVHASGAGNAVVKDPKDSGSLYPASTYKNCDITEVKAQVKRGNLIVKVTLRGKQPSPNTYLNLNISGAKKSNPEYIAQPHSSKEGRSDLYRVKKFNEFGYQDYEVKEGAAKLKSKQGGKSLQWELPLKKLGRPSKTGFQAQTCGEGAVDLAPGKTHFDDVNWTGLPDYQFKSVKTGS